MQDGIVTKNTKIIRIFSYLWHLHTTLHMELIQFLSHDGFIRLDISNPSITSLDAMHLIAKMLDFKITDTTSISEWSLGVKGDLRVFPLRENQHISAEYQKEWFDLLGKS